MCWLRSRLTEGPLTLTLISRILAGPHEQLVATFLMTYQNHMVLDFVIRGERVSFLARNVVYLPQTTSPDGSMTKDLTGLRTLSEHLAENSAIHNALEHWLTWHFGWWKGFTASVFISGCCCTSCVRHLSLKCITTAVDGKFPKPPPDQSAQLQSETIPLWSSDPEGLELDEIHDSSWTSWKFMIFLQAASAEDQLEDHYLEDQLEDQLTDSFISHYQRDLQLQ